MACQQLVNHVAASAKFLASIPAENRAAVMTGQLAAVQAYIERLSGPQEAFQGAQAIQEHYNPFLSALALSDLLGLLNDVACRLPALPARNSAGAGTQFWQDDFWQIVPKAEVYDKLTNKKEQATLRMQVMFCYLAERGLRQASERTFAAMLALFFYADGCPQAMNSANLLCSVQHVKNAWKAYISDYKKNIIGTDMYSFDWPGPPAGVICVTLDFVRFMSIYNPIPVRMSGVQSRRGALTMAFEPQPQANLRRALTLEDAGAQLAIDFVGHRGIAAARVGEALALTAPAPAAEQVAAGAHVGDGPAAEAIAAGASVGGGHAAKAIAAGACVGGGETLTIPLSAVEARKSLAEVTAQLQAAREKEHDDKKQAAKETRAAKQGKNQAAKEKRAAKKEKKQADKKKAAKDKKKAADKKSPMKVKKRSRRMRILNESKESKKAAKIDVVASAQDPRPVSICKQCGSPDGLELADGKVGDLCILCQSDYGNTEQDVDVRKKPAARPVPQTKAKAKAQAKAGAAPAKASGAAPPEELRNANRSADKPGKRAFFMKWGCTKCRWLPGCTKSCWKSRNMEQPVDVD